MWVWRSGSGESLRELKSGDAGEGGVGANGEWEVGYEEAGYGKMRSHTELLPAQRRVPSVATVTLATETSSSGMS